MGWFGLLMRFEGARVLSLSDIWRGIMDFGALKLYCFALLVFEVRFANAKMTVYS